MNSKEDSQNDKVEVVDLDEQPLTFSGWRKGVFASLSHHKRTWLAVVCTGFCILILVTAFSIPVVRNNVWSKVSGIPLTAMSVQMKGRELYAQRTIDHTVIWHVTLDDTLLGSPQVVNHVLYVLTRKQTYYALRETNGTLLWKYSYRDFTIDPPVFDEGILYVTSHTGSIRATRASDGSLIWHVSIQGNITSPVIVNHGTIYFSRNHNSVVALRTKDGSLLWQASVQGIITSTLLFNGNTLYFTENQNMIEALRANDGIIIWQTPLKVIPASTNPQAHSELLHVGNVIIDATMANPIRPNEVYIVGLRTDGSLLWTVSKNVEIISTNFDTVRTVVMQEEKLYMLFIDGTISAYGINKGTLLWQHKAGGNFVLSMEAIDNILYINALNGDCIGLSLQDGSQVWFRHLYIQTAAPIVFEHHLYLNPGVINGIGVSPSSQNTGIVAMNVASATFLWRYFTLVPLSSPTIVEGKVYVTDIQGEVYVLDAKSGVLQKKIQ